MSGTKHLKLTAFTNFALRILMHCTVKQRDQPEALSTVPEISEAFGISRAHLVKAAHQLGQEGFLESQRGRGGGLRLARPASQIFVGDVVRFTERRSNLVECLNPGTNSCPLIQVCKLQAAFLRARSAFFAELDTVSIDDITSNHGQLASLLGLEAWAGGAPGGEQGP